MKLWQLALLGVAIVLMCGVAAHGWAAPNQLTPEQLSTGKVGCELSKTLYGQVQSLIEGNLGLLLGLIMLLAGFWALINGAAILPSMATIIMGGLVTALPSLINSFFGGVGNLMSSDLGGVAYNPNPDCQAQAIQTCSRDDTGGDSRGAYSCTTTYLYNGQILY